MPECPNRELQLAHLYDAQQRVRVNTEQVDHLAEFIKSHKHKLPPDQEDSSLEGLDSHQIANFNLLLVAICHQTTPKGLPMLEEGTVDGTHRRGWDYLSARLEEKVKKDMDLKSPFSLEISD